MSLYKPWETISRFKRLIAATDPPHMIILYKTVSRVSVQLKTSNYLIFKRSVRRGGRTGLNLEIISRGRHDFEMPIATWNISD